MIGRRLLRPFRVHHVNPDDFTRRRFLDVNGDVAMIVLFFLLAALAFPLERTWGRLAEGFFFSFCLVGIPTNQVTLPPAARKKGSRHLVFRGSILELISHYLLLNHPRIVPTPLL